MSATASNPPGGRRRGCLRIAGLIYLVLLAASHLVRWVSPAAPPAPAAYEEVAEVPVVGGEGEVRLAWADWRPAGKERRLPILLLHGSPGSHADFRRLGPALAARGWRAVAPDLPGFGASGRDQPDTSIRAHAGYALELLDRLGIERVHVLGYSMGGGVALDLYDRAPERVASVTLLSAIGVQELELLGDYHLNHLVHGLQLGALWLATNLVPHFGFLDRFPLNLSYAHNFFDSDQRPLRGILRRLEPPVLIVHGTRDPLVPVAAAREHYRLVPQSRLVLLPTDHFYLFQGGEELVLPPIVGFLEDVEAGRAMSREEAPPGRVAASARPFDPRRLPEPSGLAVVATMLLLALATLVSEDLTCIGAGLLVAQGRLPFAEAAVACFIGIYGGDLLLFVVGRFVGRRALHLPPISWWLSEEAVTRSSAWFRRRGAAVIALSRVTPGSRLATYFAAGLLRTSFWRFALYFLIAAAVWTPFLVALAAALGSEVLTHLEWLQGRMLGLLLLALVLLVVLRKLVLPLFTYGGRRRLVGTWRRWTRWELWPPWLFYPPVALYVLALGLRYRSLTLFTAANPGIPAGGWVGESKAQILSSVRDPEGIVPPWRLLPAADPLERRLDAVEEHRRRFALDYPLVLKPDVGQRGSGVAVVRGPGEVREYLQRTRVDTLVQAYAPGEEFGVFYYRRPGAEAGRVFSITEKRMPRVVGDGRRTVEELILADPRAVALADLYLELQGEGRWEVPEAGHEVQLVELGTHCRGAVFLDGADCLTPELEETVEGLSRRIPGFYFGRYDLRAPSREALARGGPFQVIEVNGVTSEATHIYDPGIGLLTAWATLMRQWRLAFEIGAANRARGVCPARLRELLRALAAYRRQARSHPGA